jgi:hypothetical protein
VFDDKILINKFDNIAGWKHTELIINWPEDDPIAGQNVSPIAPN